MLHMGGRVVPRNSGVVWLIPFVTPGQEHGILRLQRVESRQLNLGRAESKLESVFRIIENMGYRELVLVIYVESGLLVLS